MEKIKIKVGKGNVDIKGFTNEHIQYAVDRAAFFGGGIVELSEGIFNMADSLHLRDGVLVIGKGNKTILKKNPMKQARILGYLGYGHNDIIVDKPDIFEIGEGVIVGDDKSVGFYQTLGTLIAREGNTWFYNQMHAHDYGERDNAFVKTLFPIISAVNVNDAHVENIVIEGNSAKNELMNGCRGAGFYAYRSNKITAKHIIVRDYNGEGFGFQTCDDLRLEHCIAEQCAGNGFHPGSGSNRFVITDCIARKCGACGLFYCLRMRDSVLQNCTFEDNREHGVSIGERDIRHINRNLIIRNNGGAGIYFRDCSSELAAHGNVVENCRLEGNCRKDGEAEIVLQGETKGIKIIGNRIHRRKDKPGILIKERMPYFEQRNNVITPAGHGAYIDLRKQ